MSKKNTHIDVKDNGIKLANGIGDELSNLSHSLELHISKKLSEGTDNVRTWQIKQNNAIREFKNESGKIVNDTKKNIKEKIKNDDTVNLNSKQAKRIATEVNDGALLLQSNAIRTWENTKNKILTTLRVNSATSLKEEVAKHIDSGLKLDVVYKDGREYKFDTYFEMKARTDIQKDIADNMIKAGQAGGVVFYIAAYFGDCAKDHVDYQGKIYVDEKWESIAPKDRIEEIREYINSNNIMTVQDVVTEKGNFLTSRPNCRHYFQYVDIDSVIGAKTDNDVSKLRDQMNLNFNGKYKPEKYEALQKQRLNERKIRAEKQEIEKQELELHLKPGNKAIQSKILAGEAKVRRIQAEQRELIKSYNNLERSYDREALGNRVNLGTRKTLTHGHNSSIIDVEIDEMTPCLRRNETNEIVSTHFEEVDFKKYKGFKFDWSKKTSDNSKLEALYADGDDRIQGLLSYRIENGDRSIVVELVESSKHNNSYYLGNSKLKEYSGVGAHLFAQAIKHSYEAGFDGFIYFTAKTKLIEYYKKELKAKVMSGQMMYIDTEDAKTLFIKYYGEEEYKKYATNNQNKN